MLLISFFSFAIIDLAPGDISSMYLTEDMSPEEKQIVIEKLGLNKSMPEQYWAWLKEALQGNLVFLFPTKHRWHPCCSSACPPPSC